MKEDKTRRMIILAAWSCLRLEYAKSTRTLYPSSDLHDIKEHLPVPPSLFQARYHGSSLHPTFVSAKGSYESVFLVHLAQATIEDQLRRIYRELDGDECSSVSPFAMRIILKGHQRILRQWRAKLPCTLGWDDRDPPPSDFLLARLRATYWEAMHAINKFISAARGY